MGASRNRRRAYAVVPVTDRIIGHIASRQPAIPVAVKVIWRFCTRKKRGVTRPRWTPSSLSRKVSRIQRRSAGQVSCFRSSALSAG